MWHGADIPRGWMEAWARCTLDLLPSSPLKLFKSSPGQSLIAMKSMSMEVWVGSYGSPLKMKRHVKQTLKLDIMLGCGHYCPPLL